MIARSFGAREIESATNQIQSWLEMDDGVEPSRVGHQAAHNYRKATATTLKQVRRSQADLTADVVQPDRQPVAPARHFAQLDKFGRAGT